MEGTDEEVETSVSPVRRFRRLQRILIGLALILLGSYLAANERLPLTRRRPRPADRTPHRYRARA